MRRSNATVTLASTSVYPESLSSAFELASVLGYDGIELMIGIDPVSTDLDYVEKMRDYHQVAVSSIHAPVLLVTQNVWGNDHWEKLRRTIAAADRLDADVVVVHPPFRWQGEYASGFVDGLADLQKTTKVKLCVENMYPWRVPANVAIYLPSWDPTDFDFEFLTLDLSHAATAQVQSLDYVQNWGTRLHHLHLSDGSSSAKDDHFFPGEGNQRPWEVVKALVGRGFSGHIVHEINTKQCCSPAEREEKLAKTLAKTRELLGQDDLLKKTRG